MRAHSILYRFLILIFFPLISFSFTCSSNVLKLSIELKRLDLWLNLMPGGPGSFHLAAEVNVKNDENYDLKNFNAANISIFQSGNLIYSFRPRFESENGNSNYLYKSQEKIYLISSNESLPINKNLDPNIFVDVFITFEEESGKLFVHKIENVKVEKVY